MILLRPALAFLLAAAPLATYAGTLDHGNWTPKSCGSPPQAPTGLNLTDQSAYNRSMKWVQDYETAFQKFDDCIVKEANDDSHAINDYVQGEQIKAKDFFDKANEDSKTAQKMFSGPDDGSGQRGSHNHSGFTIGGPGSGGGDSQGSSSYPSSNGGSGSNAYHGLE
jgi:hypothetical protein